MSEESKFNFSEEEKIQIDKDKVVEEKKQAVKDDAKGLFASVKTFLSKLLDFRDDTDRDATIEAIKADIPFKGATAWILICSIFVASVGLNADSTAVVIGAMLISPLMGPILGIGLSIAINDIDTLKKSLINLATMIVLSLLTAFLFFKFFPLGNEETSELLGRVAPDIRDVLIAFFGGLALIIARTKKGTIASVIFGVAIATALMPPLCTAGYGLANGNWEYFGGAMNLFTINTIFIALATFIVLKVLRFPMLRYANSSRRKRIARFAALVAVIVMVYPTITFLKVLKKSQFETSAEKFINNELDALPNPNYIKKYATPYFEPNGIGTSVIELTTFGTDLIADETRAVIEQHLKKYAYLDETKLIVNQAKNRVVNNLTYMEELRTRDSLDLMSQQQKINFLEDRIQKLARLEQHQIPFESLSKEVQINYENLETFSYATVINSNFNKIDTLLVFSAKWRDSLSTPDIILKDKTRLEKWLKLKLAVDTLVVKQIN